MHNVPMAQPVGTPGQAHAQPVQPSTASFYSANQAALRHWFDNVDVDRSGAISAPELQRALAQGGLSYSLKSERRRPTLPHTHPDPRPLPLPRSNPVIARSATVITSIIRTQKQEGAAQLGEPPSLLSHDSLASVREEPSPPPTSSHISFATDFQGFCQVQQLLTRIQEVWAQPYTKPNPPHIKWHPPADLPSA
ncbi:MAG: hypothetical protein SGPRY_007150 [Prymnesium sp.]